MKEEIRKLGEEINQKICELRRIVRDLPNDYICCDCDDCVIFDFSNILPKTASPKYCLNCGGVVRDK